MADWMTAEIWIGGKLPRQLVPEMPIEGLWTDWYGTPCVVDPDKLMEIANENNGYLHLIDVEAPYGELPELEEWLQQHELPFRRFSDGKYEHDTVIVESRPDLENWPWRRQLASKAGNPLTDATAIAAVLQRMKPFVDAEKPPSFEEWLKFRKVYEELRSAVPEPFPPMPKFEVV